MKSYILFGRGGFDLKSYESTTITIKRLGNTEAYLECNGILAYVSKAKELGNFIRKWSYQDQLRISKRVHEYAHGESQVPEG